MTWTAGFYIFIFVVVLPALFFGRLYGIERGEGRNSAKWQRRQR